jgi:protease IV
MFWNKQQKQLETSLENSGPPQPWERELVTQVVTASLTESRRARRWTVFFRLAALGYFFVLLVLMLPDQLSDLWSNTPHTALVDVKGVIASDTPASADKIVEGLRDAFDDKHTKGVILRINSPGGSPVQAGYVYDEIRRLRAKHPTIPLYAVIADTGASGAYYIAAAADAIYADKASLVGSIGVLMNGFGFVGTLKTLGVERRLLTAGDHKGILDPFSPLSDQDQHFAKALLERLHQQFITAVTQGRKGKLKDDPKIFSGLFWSGEEAQALGLVDGLGGSGYVAREIIHADKVVDYTHKDDWVKRFSERLGASMGGGLGHVLVELAAPTFR